MTPTITTGRHTIAEILARAGITMDEVIDYRRVKIGGLGFDYLDELFLVPESATSVTVTLDGEVFMTFTVTSPTTAV